MFLCNFLILSFHLSNLILFYIFIIVFFQFIYVFKQMPYLFFIIIHYCDVIDLLTLFLISQFIFLDLGLLLILHLINFLIILEYISLMFISFLDKFYVNYLALPCSYITQFILNVQILILGFFHNLFSFLLFSILIFNFILITFYF